MKSKIPTMIPPGTEADRTIRIRLTTVPVFGSTGPVTCEPLAAYLVVPAAPSKWRTHAMPTGHGAPGLQIGEFAGWSWYLSGLIGLGKDERQRMYLPSNSLAVDFGAGLVCVNAAALVEECLGRLLGTVQP